MNESNKQKLKKIAIKLDKYKNQLEEMECDIDNQIGEMNDKYEIQIEEMETEMNQIWEFKDTLETLINDMEEQK